MLLVCRRFSSKVASTIAKYGDPRHDERRIKQMRPCHTSSVRQVMPPNPTQEFVVDIYILSNMDFIVRGYWPEEGIISVPRLPGAARARGDAGLAPGRGQQRRHSGIYIYIYIYIYVCMYMYIHIYIYVYGQRRRIWRIHWSRSIPCSYHVRFVLDETCAVCSYHVRYVYTYHIPIIRSRYLAPRMCFVVLCLAV